MLTILFACVQSFTSSGQCKINYDNLTLVPEVSDEFNYSSHTTMLSKWSLENEHITGYSKAYPYWIPDRINRHLASDMAETHILNGSTITLKVLKLDETEWAEVNVSKATLINAGRTGCQNRWETQR